MDLSLTTPGPRPAAPHQTARELLRHGLVTLAICATITALLSLADHSRWDVNLAYSLGIGTISWLTIDLGRLWWSRHGGIRWPSGWRGMALVAAGIANGFVLGSMIGRLYASQGSAGWLPDTPQAFWYPLLLTVGATVVISAGFYLQGKASHLARQMAEARREAAEARLTLLRAQLDPHMLFNTLANLQALIALDPPRAQAMVGHLTQYLRATLDGSRGPEHTLRDEFALLNDYLELMAIRMGSRLRHQLDLPEELASATLPPLLLQPLVENAIRHGLEPRVAGGLVRVRARWSEDPGEGGTSARNGNSNSNGRAGYLELTVSDDGQGLPDAATLASPGSFGLAQIRERLARRYGGQAGLELASPASGGTVARITLPCPAP